MHTDITIVKNIRDDAALRSSFNRLAEKTFDLNFENWYQNGYWKENYIPYAAVREGQVIANVSVNPMTFSENGILHHYIQLGTVMTDSAFRGQGLCRLLMEAVEKDVMDRKPKPKDEGIFAHGLGVRVVLQGVMFAILTLIGFVAGENVTGTLAGGQTLAFMVLSLSQVVQAFNMRSEHSLFKIGPFSNHKLNWAALASLAMVCLVLFTPVGIAFGLITLPWELYLLGLGLILHKHSIGLPMERKYCMEKKTLKTYLLLISFTIGLVLVVVHFETIPGGIGVFLRLLTPLFIGIVIAFVLNRPYEWLNRLYREKCR